MAGFNLRTIFQDIAAPSEEELAQQRQQQVEGLIGSPSQQVDVNVPDTTALNMQPGQPLPLGANPMGLMAIEQQGTPSSGLFTDLSDNQVPMMQTIKGLMGSTDPLMQKQGYSMLTEFQKGANQEIKPTSFMQNFDAFQRADEETQQQIIDYKKAGAQNISLGGDGTGRIWTPEQVEKAGLQPGSVVVTDRRGIPKVIKSEKYTQAQIVSGGFATRMSTATDDIERVMKTDFDPSGAVQNIDMFAVPNLLANYMRTPEGQQYRQAQENWITANLRKESGAAIPEEETEREILKWFPVPGDGRAAVKQKRRSRKDAQRSMVKASGGVWKELQEEKRVDRAKEAEEETIDELIDRYAD